MEEKHARRGVSTDRSVLRCWRWSTGACPSPGPARSGSASSRPGSTRPTGSSAPERRPRLPFDEVTPGQDGAGVVDAVGRRRRPGSRRATGSGCSSRSTSGPRAPPPSTPSQPAGRRPAARGRVVRPRRLLGVPALTAHRALTVAEDGPRRLAPGRAGRPDRPGRRRRRGGRQRRDPAGPLGRRHRDHHGQQRRRRRRWPRPPAPTTSSNYRRGRRRRGDPRDRAGRRRPRSSRWRPAQNIELDLAVLRNRGTVAIYANNGGDQLTLARPRRRSRQPALPVRAALHGRPATCVDAAAEDVAAAVDAGALRVGRGGRPAAAPLPARGDRRRARRRRAGHGRQGAARHRFDEPAAPGAAPGRITT